MSYSPSRIGALALLAAAGFPLLQADGPVSISNYSGTTPAWSAPGAPAGSYVLSGFDTVNLGNLHLNFSLPLVEIPGRGDARTTMMLPFERNWQVFAVPFAHDCNQFGQCEFSYTYAVSPNSWNPQLPLYGKGTLVGRTGGDGCLQVDPSSYSWQRGWPG